MNNPKVAEYYDYTLPFYDFFWHRDTHAVHYGLWEKGTANLHEALINTNYLKQDWEDTEYFTQRKVTILLHILAVCDTLPYIN